MFKGGSSENFRLKKIPSIKFCCEAFEPLFGNANQDPPSISDKKITELTMVHSVYKSELTVNAGDF